jgi:exopolyphosphatase/guanosine-5'-triphosphate,3'-diphosphate pyrophosphatase
LQVEHGVGGHAKLAVAPQIEVDDLAEIAGAGFVAVINNRPEDEETGQLLEWAASLHEIGQSISHSQYQKHGAYLLHHLDMPGFSRGDQNRLATLVRTHRRKIPLADFGAPPEGERLLHLAVLLRLAVVLHRARGAGEPPEVSLKMVDNTLRLGFPAGWLAGQSLTTADLEQEAEYLRGVGYKLKFK